MIVPLLALVVSAVMITVGISLFVTSDSPFNARGITGWVMYMTGCIAVLIYFW